MSDLISRADAIEVVCRAKTKEVAYKGIRDLPSADADRQKVVGINDADRQKVVGIYQTTAPSADAVQGEWNTGKPTKRGKYIVTLIGIGDYRFVDIMHYDKPCMPNREVSGECWYCDDDEWGDVVYDDTDILAWMPLPTPYKGGDSE